MDWQDDEFELFLRQFRPHPPKALPTRRRTVVALAVAAVIVAGLVVPTRFAPKSPVADGSEHSSALTPSGAAKSAEGMGQRDKGNIRPAIPVSRVPDATGTPTKGEKNTAPKSISPMSSAAADTRQPGASRPHDRMGAASGTASRRIRVGGTIKPPIKLVDAKPIYPDDARAAGIEGVIVLEIVIGESGSVIEARVLRSIPELDQAAIDAVNLWQFEPTLLNGEPVEVEMNVTINFTLQ
ncbi:MAG: TonB family protein [Luteitalea sp.]|nr:TonB family protein [Luteitalea sp.]